MYVKRKLDCCPVETGKIVREGYRSVLVDFGKDAFGQVIVELDTQNYEMITIACGECLREGRLDPSPGCSRVYCAATMYATWGHNVLEMPFPKHQAPDPSLPNSPGTAIGEVLPFRYVEIAGVFSNPVVKRRAVYGEIDDEAADFVSSSPELNRVWEFCKYSMKATGPFEFYVDGHRERLPYEGDAYINQLGAFCCDARYDQARRTISRLLANPTWPLEWRLLMPVIARDYVLYSGDTESAEGWREALREDLFEGYRTENGLIPQTLPVKCRQGGTQTIVDWPQPSRDGMEFGLEMLVPNCYLYGAMRAYAELYRDLRVETAAAELYEAIRREFRRCGRWTDVPGGEHTAVHSLFFPAVFGLAEAEELPELAAELGRRGMKCSVFGAQFLLEALYRGGRGDLALAMLTSPDSPGWLNMMAQGSTITMEAWSNEDKPNQDWNHAWGGAPANIIPRWLAGIRPLSPGFARFLVAPNPGGLKYFRLKHPTPAGPVTVEYDGGVTAVTLPDGRKSVVDKAAEFTL